MLSHTSVITRYGLSRILSDALALAVHPEVVGAFNATTERGRRRRCAALASREGRRPVAAAWPWRRFVFSLMRRAATGAPHTVALQQLGDAPSRPSHSWQPGAFHCFLLSVL